MWFEIWYPNIAVHIHSVFIHITSFTDYEVFPLSISLSGIYVFQMFWLIGTIRTHSMFHSTSQFN